MKPAALRLYATLLAIFVGICISHPSLQADALTLVGEWKPDFERDSRKTQVVANRLYKAAGSDGVLIFDVTDPGQPVQLGNYKDPLGSAETLVIKDKYALVAFGERELQIIDIQNPAAPFRANGFYAPNRPGGGPYGTPGPPVIASDLILDGDILYLADGFSGLQILNMAQPENPVLLKYLQTPAAALALSLNKPLITVIGQQNKWDIDISNPSAPLFVSTAPAPAITPTVAALAVSGNYLYVASHFRGLDVLDISDPARPLRVGGLELSSWTFDMALDGDILLLANYSYGAQVIDISDPATPKLVGNFQNGQNVWGVAIAGNRGYVVARNLHILDLTVPSSPQLLGVYQVSPFAYRVEISGNLAFLSKFNDGPAEIVNVSDPANPVSIGSFPVTAYTMTVNDGKAYLAQDSGFSIFDVSNPAAPILLASGDTTESRGVAVQGSFAFFGQNSAGVLAFDVSDPTKPALLQKYDTDVHSTDIAIGGNIVFAADALGGLKIFRAGLFGLRLRSSPLAGTRTFTITGGTAGKEYLLEHAESLAPTATWNQIATIFLQGDSGTIQDPNPSSQSSFYRLREQ